MVEVTEGLSRVRTRPHQLADVENKLGVAPQSHGWGAGLDTWFVMTHIMDKQLLRLAASLGETMIDGTKLTPEIYAKSYIPIQEIIDKNPGLQIAGVLSEGSWIYSDSLEAFPDQPVCQIRREVAGTVVELGPADEIGMPAQAAFATGDPRRAKAAQNGTYTPGVAARFIDYAGIRDIISRLGV